MTPTRATVLAALVAALGLTAMGPAFAAGPDRSRDGREGREHRMLDFGRDARGGAFRLIDLSCNDRAADRLERRLERMGSRLDLTADQQKLFDDFRTSMLTAQTSFADQCDTIRPANASADARPAAPNPVERMEQRLKFDEARVAAMSELLPQFKAFYESLTDAQKKQLDPRGMRPVSMHQFRGPGMPQFHMRMHPGADAPGLDG